MLSQNRQDLQQVLQLIDGWKTNCGSGALPVLNAIAQCRTQTLGFYLYRCNDKQCDHTKMQYHSCRNRHCPHCGNARKEDWIEARLRELLPCKYYHVVFTLPHELNSMVMCNRKVMFNLLLEASAYTLNILAQDEKHPGATPGVISVLHTWGQQLSFHPHVHCVVTGNGWREKDQQWVAAKKVRYKRLFPVQEEVYRAYFLKRLRQVKDKGEIRLTDDQKTGSYNLMLPLRDKRWVVYAKEPFGGPAQVIEYLGRYTHKVAISNSRIKAVSEAGEVTFDYKDYADQNKIKQMTLSGMEFIRRFEQHILPRRFCKIRSYGLNSNNKRHTRVKGILKKLKLPQHPPPTQVPWHVRFMERYGNDPLLCPCCKKSQMVLVQIVFKKKNEVKRE
jgi:hypothetical protein